MNKIYTVLVIFAIGGLLFANIPTPGNATSNLDYMLVIAENAKKYCKSEIEARENIDPEILELYLQSISEIDKLTSAINANDVKSAREHFVLSMQNMRQISLMINEIEIDEAQRFVAERNPVLDRYEINIQKLKSISTKLGAIINFEEIDKLMESAKESHKRGDSEKTKNLINEIAKQGNATYQVLKSINEENKIIRAKALAEKHIQQINILILQANELGLQDSANKLEQSKINLIAANNTKQIKQTIKVVILLNNMIEKSKIDMMQEMRDNEIQLSNKQKLSLQISQLENKINMLDAEAYGNNAAIYYLEKATMLVKSAKIDLDKLSNISTDKLNQIENLITKVERILQEAT